MKNLLRNIFKILIFVVLVVNQNIFGQDTTAIVRAGLRSSSYGFSSFPDSSWWFNATTDMASNFGEEISPAVIWILGYTSNGGCYLNFPNPNQGTTYSKITFSDNDKNEHFLNDFDSNGVKVWLQVEPGFADVSTLIDLVLTQYSHHTCVIGFGVDVEWYKTNSSNNNEGEAVTDQEAEAWSTKVKTYNSNYLLFTKHWLISKMPPTFRNDIVFVDDSQIFTKMEDMISEFEEWGRAFSPAKVSFQYGYSSDKVWWNDLANPPKAIGDEILKRIPNTSDLYWVDFTAYDIWPKGFSPTSIDDVQNLPTRIELNQNYPNPFNPTTTIKYTVQLFETMHGTSLQNRHVLLKVYDVLGKEITTLVNEKQKAGNHQVQFNANNLASGIYYYKLSFGDLVETKQMVLLR